LPGRIATLNSVSMSYIKPFGDALVASIGVDELIITMQQIG
jgi:hypothetical protein